MYQDRILLTSQDIYEKQFKMDTRGYRPQEVDKFLDVVSRDYEEWEQIIKEKERENKSLVDDNIRLKQEVRILKSKFDMIKEEESIYTTSNNSDLLKRISNLEKIIYGKE